VADPREVRRRIGYVFGGDKGLYERLSGYDNLRYFAELYGVPPREQKGRIAELLDLVSLTGKEGQRVEGYSRGMRQRLHIARGLLHKPEVLFLDEPSIGIDPVGARQLRETVAALVSTGTTVLLTTHYMFEADELCDRIAVIAGGAIIAEGTPDQLKSRVADGHVVEIEVYDGVDDRLDVVRAIDGVTSVGVETSDRSQLLVVRTAAAAQVTPAVLAALDGLSIGRVATREPTLEDAYVELVRDA
jgi:ABC-2 type transport system ATP-binding protein